MSKNNSFLIVMYHHIRRDDEVFFPKLKSLNFKIFKNQLDYLQKKYHIINYIELVKALSNKKYFKKPLCCLTFDDGYLNHFQNVYPELKSRNLQGFFFSPTSAVVDRKLMNINKIHLLLASGNGAKKLNKEVENLFYEMNIEEDIKKSFKYLEKIYKKPNIFDNANVIFFKRLLQKLIPEKYRNIILDILLSKYLKENEYDLADQFYMNTEQIKIMVRDGMYFGNHCHNHLWLETLKKKEQEVEISKGVKFLNKIGISPSNWIMCYPFGSYNQTTLKILKEKKCLMGLTTKKAAFNFKSKSKLEIPRIDARNVFEY